MTRTTMTPTQETRWRELAHFLRTGQPPASATEPLDRGLPFFCMNLWHGRLNNDAVKALAHPVPSVVHTCNTACCIGGYYDLFWGDSKVEDLGLSFFLRDALFYPADGFTPWAHVKNPWAATPEEAAVAIDTAVAMARAGEEPRDTHTKQLLHA